MKVTIKDIAKMANVSIATVSKVINNKDERISLETKNRVLNIIKEQGYIPNRVASSMVTKKTKTLGLIIPDITNPFFPELTRGVEDFAKENGYTLILCNSDNNLEKEDAYIDMLQEKMVDGIIFTASSKRDKISESLKKIKLPVISVDRDIKGLKVQGKIIVDNESGAYDGVNYMINRGYKKIYHITGPMISKPSKDRYKGYIKAYQDNKMNPPKDHLLEKSYTSKWGYEAVMKLLNSNVEFDGIFCGNDLIALGAIKALHSKKIKIPKEVGVLGFDNIYMSSMIEPELTTVEQPKYKMGYEAARLLVKLIKKEIVKNNKYILKTKLIKRKTTR
ncbi:LacI family DNA-binding transcriptional regulator [Peptostreptococcaceae bacterium AGR-M142]